MEEVNYLGLDEILAIHYDQIERYGGSHGIRDLNLLISAITRPQASFAGADLYSDIFSKAAALFHSIVLNHAFVDGNKRTATVSTARFMFINGYCLKFEKKELVNTALKVESKKWDLATITSWLKRHSRKI